MLLLLISKYMNNTKYIHYQFLPSLSLIFTTLVLFLPSATSQGGDGTLSNNVNVSSHSAMSLSMICTLNVNNVISVTDTLTEVESIL